jgi:hypothetical protein
MYRSARHLRPPSVKAFYESSGFTEAAMSTILPGNFIATEPVVYSFSVDAAQEG